MELQELKQKWTMLNDRLSKSELYNKRVLMETIQGHNKTAYEQLSKQGIFNFLTTLFVPAFVVPLLHEKGIFRDTSFYLLEAICVLGVLMVVCRLFITSKLNVVEAPGKQLKALVNYKRCYVYESIIGTPLAAFGICFTLYLEHMTSPLGIFFVALFFFTGGIFFVALFFFTGLFCGWIGYRRHKSTMQEIERNIKELEGLSA